MDEYKKFEIKYRLHEMYRSITRPFSNLWWNIGNYISWMPVLWNNWDWDHIFFIYIMEHKLKKMKEYHEKHGIAVCSSDIAREIGVVLECINRIKKNNYCKVLYAAHNDKYGELECEFIPTSGRCCEMIFFTSKIPKDQKELLAIESKERAKIFKHGEYLMKQDYDYMFDFMSKHIRGWWD